VRSWSVWSSGDPGTEEQPKSRLLGPVPVNNSLGSEDCGRQCPGDSDPSQWF
jgi:hypothetical protein